LMNADRLLREPALFEVALELLTEAAADNESERPFLPIHPDTLRRGLQMQRGGVLAMIDGTLQGLLAWAPDGAVAGGMRINYLVVRKSCRGQGIATAMLARAVQEAGLIAARVVAPATGAVTAWLTRRRFAQVADRLVLERIMRRTVQVAAPLLDDYTGSYLLDMPPGVPIVIERHGALLISKTRDMRDVLFPASETEFFTRHHYGRGRFERDAFGRVTRLVCTEGSREFVAVKQ
jgi:GNAT superfamily N-acetyltransferase